MTLDPSPIILSVTIDNNFNITGVINAGPSTINPFTTWWEVTVSLGIVIRAAVLTGQIYGTNTNHTDTWSLSLGEDWSNLPIAFIMQDATLGTIYSSAPVILTDPRFDHKEAPPRVTSIKPLSPGGISEGPGIYRQPIIDNSRR